MVKINRPLQFDAVIEAPFGAIGLSINGEQVAITLLSGKYEASTIDNPRVTQAVHQITTYLTNPTDQLQLPLAKGTPFQERVWQAIRTIPAGQVMTYQQLALQLGSGARAVANACGANPQPLVVPCHRVVAKNGLGGFMCGDPHGQQIKTWLLQHEGVNI